MVPINVGELVGAPNEIAVDLYWGGAPVSYTYRMSSGICLDKSSDGMTYTVFIGGRSVSYPRHVLSAVDDINGDVRRVTSGKALDWMKTWLR